MCRGRARVKPSEFPARRVAERASQPGSRRHGSNRVDANESGSVRLGGTFKDAAWVKPSRDRERHQKEELRGEIHRGGTGKTEPASREWRRGAAASREDERFDRRRKIACGASCGSEDSRDIGSLILRTAGRCEVRSSKGIVSTRAAPKRRIENGESMSGLPGMWNPKDVKSRSAGQ